MTQVRVEQGLLKGLPEQGVFRFGGVPYAAPPVGNLRWAAPQPPASWDGVRDASAFGNAAIQTADTGEDLGGPQSEDCLYLNVWTTSLDQQARQPVMVWIHGGGFLGGAGSMPGSVLLLDGHAIAKTRTRDVARKIGLLPQGPAVPDGLSVIDLVARGRYPHQSLRNQWSTQDETIVRQALTATRLTELADRRVDELSGGQRQRVWIALVLAQDTPILLLDEPTTFLDIAHQLEILSLLAQLNDTEQRTVVLVLHDINQAARYSHHIIAMRNGRIIAEGPPRDVIIQETIADTFGIHVAVITDPLTGAPLCVPGTVLPNHHT